MTRSAVVLAALGAVMLPIAALTSAPTMAQEGGALGHPAGGEPPPSPPDYAFEDGTVYVDGDEVLDCRSFVEAFDEGYYDWGDQEQAARVLEQCERAGVPSVDPPPEVSREIRSDLRAETLPETGGARAIPLTAGLLLAIAGLLALRSTPRRRLPDV